jgi:hypothetical protein
LHQIDRFPDGAVRGSLLQWASGIVKTNSAAARNWIQPFVKSTILWYVGAIVVMKGTATVRWKGTGDHVRQASGMPSIQSLELQGVLQSEAMRLCPSGQNLPEKEKNQAQRKKITDPDRPRAAVRQPSGSRQAAVRRARRHRKAMPDRSRSYGPPLPSEPPPAIQKSHPYGPGR